MRGFFPAAGRRGGKECGIFSDNALCNKMIGRILTLQSTSFTVENQENILQKVGLEEKSVQRADRHTVIPDRAIGHPSACHPSSADG